MTMSGEIRTADDIRRRNAELDDELRRVALRAAPEELHADPGDGEWTLAQTLAHVGEFPRFAAGELARQLAAEGVEVGRSEEDPARNAVVDQASSRNLEELLAAIDEANRELAQVLERVTDEDLDRVGRNRTFGPEALDAFIDRYLLSHKAEHIEQLERTLARISGS